MFSPIMQADGKCYYSSLIINEKSSHTFVTYSVLVKCNKVPWNCLHSEKYGTFQLSGVCDATGINLKVKIQIYIILL